MKSIKNITIAEWDSRNRELREEIGRRWPWLKAEGKHRELWIESSVCSAALNLRSQRIEDGRYCTLEPRFHSAQAVMGTVSEVERGVFETRAVLDAIHFLVSETNFLRIWEVGTCPCDHCSGKGRVRCPGECEGGVR